MNIRSQFALTLYTNRIDPKTLFIKEHKKIYIKHIFKDNTSLYKKRVYVSASLGVNRLGYK